MMKKYLRLIAGLAVLSMCTVNAQTVKEPKTDVKTGEKQLIMDDSNKILQAVCLKHVKVPMRDGIHLAADCYLPQEKGSFPVILERTPYNGTGKKHGGAITWCKRGFAYVSMDTRGRFLSEGSCVPGFNEINDGYDSIDWIASQPWCNGNIGMVGGSYVAVTQLAAAASGHPALKAIAPSAICENFYDAFYTNGVLEISFQPGWYIGMCTSKQPLANPNVKPVSFKNTRTVKPLADADIRMGKPCKPWHDVIENPLDNVPLWTQFALSSYAKNIQCPFFIATSYYDSLGRSGIEIYTKLMADPNVSENFKKHSWLRIGPWGHGVNTPEGDVDFGKESLITEDFEIDFLTSLLTGKDPVTDKEPGRICYFTMGENKWHYTNTWPLPNTEYTALYLESGGQANTAAGNGTLSAAQPAAGSNHDSFVYDPENPVPSCGGRIVHAGGQKNQTEVEKRQDVLVYTSPVLTDNITVTGNVCQRLYVSSTAKDTDFTVKLVDVYPDGRPFNICDGIQRARWRNGAKKPQFLIPGQVYEIDMNVDVTSYQFQKGHSIRVEISSSNYPKYECNLNTGAEVNAKEITSVKANQLIYHSKQYPSCIILPVVNGKLK